MGKVIFYGDDARDRFFFGVDTLYGAVSETYGPRGGNVVIGRGFGAPTVTHDGVTVAESVELPVDWMSLGATEGVEMIKQAASQLNKSVGDGTTTVTILTRELLREALKHVKDGVNPQIVRREMEKAGRLALDKLSEMGEDVSDNIAQVATISAGDEKLGQLIADVFEKIGKDGVVTVEQGRGLDVTWETTEGFSFERGYVSNFFINNKEKQRVEFDNPAIILSREKLTDAKTIEPLLQQVIEQHQNILLITDDIEGEALGALVMHKLNGLNIAVVKAPSFGERRIETMQDLAELTGGKVIFKELGTSFEDGVGVIGTAAKVIIDKDSTTILGGKDVSERVKYLEAMKKDAASDFDSDVLSERIAALTGKAAIIQIGGASESEIEEVKYRVDDAIAATKAALSEGIVPGGGITILNIANSLPETGIGNKILKYALTQPFIKLVENGGFSSEDAMGLLAGQPNGIGVNVKNDELKLVNMKADGVIDPVKVTKECLQSALSIASTAVTMTCLIVEAPDDEE